MKRIAIITGATSGVGHEFARQLDGTYYGQIDEFWLVARNKEKLQEACSALYTPARAFALDLCEQASFDALTAALASEDDICVSWLINSAGFGWFGDQTSADPALMMDMVRLNCLAVVQMCELALPYMASGSRIVNMSSVAAYLPLPQMGVYAATKRFVLDLTRALNEELAGTNINACAICPKAMQTGFWKDAGEDTSLGFALGTENVYDVVRKAIDAVNAGQDAIITSPSAAVVCGIAKLLPYGALCAGASLLHIYDKGTGHLSYDK